MPVPPFTFSCRIWVALQAVVLRDGLGAVRLVCVDHITVAVLDPLDEVRLAHGSPPLGMAE